MKKIVNVFSQQGLDNEHKFTLGVEHPQNRSFRTNWNRAVVQSEVEHPEDWNVNDVLKILRKQGWLIIRERTIEVGY